MLPLLMLMLTLDPTPVSYLWLQGFFGFSHKMAVASATTNQMPLQLPPLRYPVGFVQFATKREADQAAAAMAAGRIRHPNTNTVVTGTLLSCLNHHLVDDDDGGGHGEGRYGRGTHAYGEDHHDGNDNDHDDDWCRSCFAERPMLPPSWPKANFCYHCGALLAQRDDDNGSGSSGGGSGGSAEGKNAINGSGNATTSGSNNSGGGGGGAWDRRPRALAGVRARRPMQHQHQHRHHQRRQSQRAVDRGRFCALTTPR